jgi:hypothetical protein
MDSVQKEYSSWKDEHLKRKDKRVLSMSITPRLPEGESNHLELVHMEAPRGVLEYFDTKRRYPFKFEVLRDTSIKNSDGTSQVWMSSTPQEMFDHLDFVDSFPNGGSLFMSGLGLAVAIRMIEASGKKIGRALVVERDEDVINLVWPYVKHKNYDLVNADVERFLSTDPTAKLAHGLYDLVILDTWPDGDYLYLPWVERIKKLGSPLKKKGGKVMVWAYDRMVDCLISDLWGVYGTVDFIEWLRHRDVFGERWPYFVPFCDAVYEGLNQGTADKPNLQYQSAKWVYELIDNEIDAFKTGSRDGLYFAT